MPRLAMRLFALLLALPAAAWAQATPPAPAAGKPPVVLQPGQMKLQARGGAPNRPDRPPQFPGGAEGMGLFFQQNVHLPAADKSQRAKGSVLVAATVQPDGRLADPKIVQGLTPECNAEALRVLALMPAWQPATRRGTPVPVLVQIPVPFADANVVQFEKDRTLPKEIK